MSTEDSNAPTSYQPAGPIDGRSRQARALKAQQEAEGQAPVPPSQRRRRASTGGFAQKLDAPPRPGYVRRWVNGNDPARIREMEELGYTMVSESAGEGSARTDGQGTRISRHAGKDEQGAPFQTFLMETPDREYQLGVQDKEEARKPFEEAIRRSADTTGQVPGAYQPGVSTIRHSG